jgi:hypothetical protein
MPFVRIDGFEGLVFVPEDDGRCCKKHDCRDCFSCQMCSDERCALCLKKRNCVNEAPQGSGVCGGSG